MINTASFSNFNFRYKLDVKDVTKDTILYIGGTFQSLESVNKPYQLWPNDLNSLIIELPGFGLSDHLPKEYGMQFYADCIDHVVKLCGLNNTPLIGYSYSYGSGPLYRYINENEHNFKCLIAGGVTTRFSPIVTSEIESLIDIALCNDPSFKTKFIDTFINKNLPQKTYKKTRILTKALLRGVSEQEVQSFAHNHLRLLGEDFSVSFVDIPTLAIVGEHDRFTCFADIEHLESNLSAFRSVKLDECDHFYHIQSERGLEYTNQFIAMHQDPIHQPSGLLEELTGAGAMKHLKFDRPNLRH